MLGGAWVPNGWRSESRRGWKCPVLPPVVQLVSNSWLPGLGRSSTLSNGNTSPPRVGIEPSHCGRATEHSTAPAKTLASGRGVIVVPPGSAGNRPGTLGAVTGAPGGLLTGFSPSAPSDSPPRLAGPRAERTCSQIAPLPAPRWYYSFIATMLVQCTSVAQRRRAHQLTKDAARKGRMGTRCLRELHPRSFIRALPDF